MLDYDFASTLLQPPLIAPTNSAEWQQTVDYLERVQTLAASHGGMGEKMVDQESLYAALKPIWLWQVPKE